MVERIRRKACKVLRFLINVWYLSRVPYHHSLGHCRGLQPAGLPVSALTSCSFVQHRQETILQCKSKHISPGLNPLLPHQALRLDSIFLAGCDPPNPHLSCHSHTTLHTQAIPPCLNVHHTPHRLMLLGLAPAIVSTWNAIPFFGSFTNSHLSSKIQTHGHLL